MLTTRLALSAIPDFAAASRKCWGLTANTMTSPARTASLGLSKQVTPYLSTSLRRASTLISTTRMSCSGKSFCRSPPINASAMLPPPMNMIFMTRYPLASDFFTGGRGFLRSVLPVPIRGSDLPFSKNRGAHAHDGRALGDRRLEVGRHPHRQGVEGEPLVI